MAVELIPYGTTGATIDILFDRLADGYLWNGSTWVDPSGLTDAQIQTIADLVQADEIQSNDGTTLGYSIAVPVGITVPAEIRAFLGGYTAGQLPTWRGSNGVIAAATFAADVAAEVRSWLGLTSANLTTMLNTLNVGQTNIKGAGFDTVTDSLVALRDAGVVLTTAGANAVADAVLSRPSGNPTAKEYSLRFLILMAMNSNTVDNSGYLTVYDPADTEIAQLPVTSDADANPITGIS